MAKYIVKEGNTVATATKEYKAGELVELTDEEAAAMPWAVDAAPAMARKATQAGDPSAK